MSVGYMNDKRYVSWSCKISTQTEFDPAGLVKPQFHKKEHQQTAVIWNTTNTKIGPYTLGHGLVEPH